MKYYFLFPLAIKRYSRSMLTLRHGNYFRITGPFAGNHVSSVDYPHISSVQRTFDDINAVKLSKLLNEQPGCLWFEMQWLQCDTTVMLTSYLSSALCSNNSFSRREIHGWSIGVSYTRNTKRIRNTHDIIAAMKIWFTGCYFHRKISPHDAPNHRGRTFGFKQAMKRSCDKLISISANM